ncbi:uncharacterized protein N0V89_011715 [Didymosphaeria variabile]|uniref:DUF2406 domain-containing protein n=1 Tax=Didymosphaeria variabile TaxID=1932322 RepID=A0A9W8XC83_9PLEO|nr:uncharacterized protein N0V89_011715 [Didymosphaeria variabile]KAJ4345582.1 hypothetical protein N0V89_011715 [Didymosphaeria variabile]
MDQQPQQTRPRSKSTFSFKSQNSHSSDPNRHEKKNSVSDHQRKVSDSYKPHLTTSGKADPNAAMNESQPIAAALEKPTLQSLRSFQHTDKDGVPIAEPDLSNPTRSRWERPLDTIRSFEAAIDTEYRRRAHTVRDSSTEVMSGYNSRRSSYYGGGGNYDQGRFSQASGYFGSRQAARDSYHDNGLGMGGPVGGMGGPPRTRYNRMQSDPGWNRYPHGNGNGVYPVQGYQQSRDTVNTNGSNGSHSEPYSTEPSSENSSIERSAGGMKPDAGEQYGFNGFGGGPILEEYHNGMGPARNGYAVQRPNGTLNYAAPPPVPMKQGPPAPPAHANKPIKLTKSNDAPNSDSSPAVTQNQSNEKRKSWFKRRFSKD